MSHYTTLSTQIVSAKHLVHALRDMGFSEVEVHAKPQPLLGWRGDERAANANVIVRRKHVGSGSNDIGFRQSEDGTFIAMISDFDRSRHGTEWLQRLTQRYAYHVALDLLEEQDFSLVEEESEQDGTIHLTLRRMG